MDKREFEGKVALVTGAGSGMGRLASVCLAEQGACVMALDVNMDTANETVAQAAARGGEATAMYCDVRRYEDICAARDKAIEKYGHIDICISFAGGFPARMLKDNAPGKTFKDWKVETLDWGVEVNFRAPLYMAHAVIGHMMERKTGVLIQIGSIDGQTGSGAIDYSAEKSGLMNGLTKSLALYGAPYGVRANCVTPGPVMTRPAMANMHTLLGRAAEPQEVVDLVLYLCSDKAAFITGANYMIDGGRQCGAVEK